MQFDPHEKFNEVQLTVHNCQQMGSGDDYWEGQMGLLPVKKEFGPLLGDDIKFKKIDEMKRIQADPMLFDPVARMAQEVYTQLVTELLARDVSEAMASGGAYGFQGKTLSVRFSAAGCELREYAVITLAPPVIVEEDAGLGRRRQLECTKAEIRVEEGTMDPKLTLYLNNPSIRETGQLLVQYGVGDLLLPERIGGRLQGGPVLRTVTADLASPLGKPPSSILTGRQKELIDEISDTLTDIKAEINSRLVFGIGCVPMILIGIGLGILQKGGHLLGAFGASCLPAAVLIVSIISGKHLTQNLGNQSSSGILIMWAGLAFLILLTAVIYRKLRRS